MPEALKYLWPVLVLQLTLQVVALINLSKRQKVKFDNKKIWILIIVFGGLIGSIGYFAFRGDDDEYGSED